MVKIKETKSDDFIVISLWDDKTLQDIKSKGGSLHDEYQVHYWALNLEKVLNDTSKFIIHIPLVFFNYPQEVSSVSIDFHLKDVEEISSKLKDIALLEASKLLKALGDNFTEFSKSCVGLHSLHRHP